MDLSDLRIFKAVVEEGGIIRAADRIGRVPSNVTTRIRQLEASIGVPLFFREKGRLVLSPNGALLLDYAQRLLQLADEARQVTAATGVHGVLRLGSLESTAASRLPGVLAAFHRACPEVRIELATGTNDAMAAAVAERRLDAAFVVDRPPRRELSRLDAFEERLVLISARGHRPIKGPKDLHDETLIAFPVGCAYRRRLERWIGHRQLAGRRVLELSSYHAIVACVACGTGVAMVPHSVLGAVQAGDVMQHRLAETYGHVKTALIWRTHEPTPQVGALQTFLGR
jgi:DNA-binding transcriptional LysR family regulator